MALGSFDIVAPLQEFQWDGTAFSLAAGLWIRAFDSKPDLRGMDQGLGEDEQKNVSFARFWLGFEWTPGTQPSPAETANLALLALWLVKPTKTCIAYRFHLGQGALGAEKIRHRLLDRFSWVQGGVHDEFNAADLVSAAQYYSAIRSACLGRGRLNDALILTLTGCWSHRWQAALISHAAAAEALLTYSTKPGITRRLSTSYACLVEAQASLRDAAYQEFRALYAIRSDIMHGRAGNVATADRLPMLIRFEDAIRRLWRVVAQSQALATVLEGTDAQREAHFLALESGYSPPP